MRGVFCLLYGTWLGKEHNSYPVLLMSEAVVWLVLWDWCLDLHESELRCLLT
jgi:hypothetical protein